MVPEHVTGHDRSSLPADFAEIVCADPDLLALEFDALVAANYPGSADHPSHRPPRRVARLLNRRLPFTWPRRPVWSEPRRFAAEQADGKCARARQRGPPAATCPADRPRRR
jgi:hypothetical protein